MMHREFEFNEARKHNARSKMQQILDRLQAGPAASSELKDVCHRFSACVHRLRQQGYEIFVSNDPDPVHRLIAYESMVEVTPEMKQAYYETLHWKQKAQERKRFDGFRCCHCRSVFDLQTHHWVYDLFEEDLGDLCTLCDTCHGRIHEYGQVKIHFPRYVTPEIAARLQ